MNWLQAQKDESEEYAKAKEDAVNLVTEIYKSGVSYVASGAYDDINILLRINASDLCDALFAADKAESKVWREADKLLKKLGEKVPRKWEE